MAVLQVKEGGGGAYYATLALALAAANNDDDIEIINTWDNNDTTAVAITQTGLSIYTTGSARHNGTFPSGAGAAHRLVVTGSLVFDGNSCNDLAVYGLAVKGTHIAYDVIDIDATGCEFGYCIAWHSPGGTGWRDTMFTRATSGVLKVFNSLVITSSTHNDAAALMAYNGGDVYASNVTSANEAASGTGNAFQNLTATSEMYCYNCIGVGGSGGAAFSARLGTMYCDYCASDDESADDHTGGNNQISQTFTFEDDTAQDYRLTAADEGAQELGSNADPNFSFTDDVVGTTRTAPWDIGFFEVSTAGGSTGSAAGDMGRLSGVFTRQMAAKRSLEAAF